MSLFGRALAGAGSGAAALANRYLDEELQANKARMLADLQFEGAKRMDEYNLGDERQARITAAEAARERAVGGARNETALAGKVAEAGSQPLRQARIDAENEVARGTAGAKADAQSVMDRAKNATDLERAAAMLPLEVKKAYAVADAAGRASAKNREAPGAEQSAKLAIVEKTLGRPLTEPEKLGLLGLAKGRDPELDTVTVTDEVDNGKGGVTKTTRKEVRRPGEKAAESADPILKALLEARAAKQGAQGGKPAATRKDPISGQDLTEGEWDRKYGRGDFKKLYKPGEPSLKAF